VKAPGHVQVVAADPDVRALCMRMMEEMQHCGRPLELAPQLGAVVEIADRLGVPAPFCRSILGLARLLSA
jgi:ketopantoate reductase